jgi:hypothetical protein
MSEGAAVESPANYIMLVDKSVSREKRGTGSLVNNNNRIMGVRSAVEGIDKIWRGQKMASSELPAHSPVGTEQLHTLQSDFLVGVKVISSISVFLFSEGA